MKRRRARWRSRIGLWKSIAMYYWKPGNRRRLRNFYGQFIRPGDLCFDIGAHVGNRTRAWVDLSARVVAVEPQPVCMEYLEQRFGEIPAVTLVGKAVGDEPGLATFHINSANPTISTLSNSDWRDQLKSDARYPIKWDHQMVVDVITLDQLIAEFGIPAFCKIDIENYEARAIRGLSSALPLVSLEYYPPKMEEGLLALEGLNELGTYEYNWSIGESMRLKSIEWIDFQALKDILRTYTTRFQYGDVYARLKTNY